VAISIRVLFIFPQGEPFLIKIQWRSILAPGLRCAFEVQRLSPLADFEPAPELYRLSTIKNHAPPQGNSLWSGIH
jgi:hypothetical protein